MSLTSPPSDLKHLEALAQRLAAHQSEILPPGASEEHIARFCERHGMRLPLDLLTWLCFPNGPRIGQGTTYGIGTENRWSDASTVLERHPTWAAAGWFPIANDGCGNYYAVVTTSGCVCFVDMMVDPDTFRCVAASSTLRFLTGMFAAELEGWVYGNDREAMVAIDPRLEGFRHVAPMPWEVR